MPNNPFSNNPFANGGGGGAGTGAFGQSSANLEELERTGRRLTMLQTYAPDLVTSSPEGALAMAEGPDDDDELLRSGVETSNFAAVRRLHDSLLDEDDSVQRSMWASLPEPVTDALTELGYKVPEAKGSGRLFGSIPVLSDVAEAALDWGEVPGVGGALEELQHAGGEVAEATRWGEAASAGLHALDWVGDLPAHAYRAQQYGAEQGLMDYPGVPVVGLLAMNNSEIAKAWSHTDRSDGYIRDPNRSQAKKAVGGDRRLYEIAHGIGTGKSPEDIIQDAGYELDSPEGVQMGLQIVQAQSDPGFQEAVHQVSTGQVSFGRSVATWLGLEDTDNGWGRKVSGLTDAGFAIVMDPTLVGGKLTKSLRFGRHAFRLETAGDLSRLSRITDLAIDGERTAQGLGRLDDVAALGKVQPWEARRARAVTSWAERVAQGFAGNDLGRLAREVPSTSTVLDTMANAHVQRLRNGERGLDSTLGTLEWLKDRDGILGVAGTRLGGVSPMVQGLRLPTLTATQRRTLQAKGAMGRSIDWARGLEGPGVKQMVAELGNPRTLVRQLGQWGVAHTLGDAGRVMAGLTAHTPYSRALPLFGNESVEEFTRLVNTGIFTNMSRSSMDEYIDAFARGGLVARSNQVEQFLEELFRRARIGDTEFAKRFVGRHRQAYALDSEDLVEVDGVMSHAGRLVDGHHADALAIPDVKEFLRESNRVNLTRWLFNNTPASWADSALGKYWKPSVLMRIGFIPRAAGEELLHFVLKHGGRTWLGAKGAEWQVNAEFAPGLRAQLTEAEALGQVDQVNRLTQQLADLEGSSITAPLRSLMSASDRAVTRLLSTDAIDYAPWRRRWVEKAHDLDDRGVVSGLEQFANDLSLRASGVFERVGELAHMPTKAEVGRIMAERWDPSAAEAARLMVTDNRVARSYTEQVSGSTMTPWEFRRPESVGGPPPQKVQVSGLKFGHPVIREVDLKPKPGEYRPHRLAGAGQDTYSYYSSIYSRHQRLAHDRVAGKVLEKTLPRWLGPWRDDLTERLGELPDVRRDLNALWAHDEAKELLPIARRIVDGDDEIGEGLLVHFGKRVDETAEALGLTNVDGRSLRRTLRDQKVPMSAKRWLLYKDVDADRLVDDWDVLERQVQHTARGRMARPDMYPRLREMRLYADERLATPVANGISKAYVPLVPTSVDMLGDDFVEAAARRIRMLGGYGPDRAERIARNVQAGVERAREAAVDMSGYVPLSAWGSADPRVADAVMGAVDEVAGTRSTFGILEVPDEALQRATGANPLGLRTDAAHWKVADDYRIEPWRLNRTKATAEQRRMVRLDVDGDWWDDAELDASTLAFGARRPGHRRLYSENRTTWADAPPDGPFYWVDVPDDVAARYGDVFPDDLLAELNVRRLPGVPDASGTWPVRERQVADGLGEIEAMERVANASTDEVFELLTTLKRQDVDNDVLHEVIEPLLRGDRSYLDEAGNKVPEQGYTWDHLVFGTQADRLPLETYGPEMATARDLTWERVVSDWFEGPVDHAISSVIRKPMFLHNFGEQVRNSKALVDLFVDEDIAAGVAHFGLSSDQLDNLALALREGDDDVAVLTAFEAVSGEYKFLADAEIDALRAFSKQRNYGLDLVRANALNRAVQLTTPFIDDHRIRSAFQNYVGNFVPFQFAEEQFLKRWVRSIFESPEMIRKAQLGMNGLRDMGVVRQDAQGNEVFVYPLVGEAINALSGPLSMVFGDNLRVPYVGAMTGRVDYALPGLGDQMGVPSVGPLIAMPLELLSRHFPELADIEETVSGPGADRPVWSYFVPSWAGRVWESAMGDVDKGQLASATIQAIQMAGVNGQLPDEGATDQEQEEFISRMEGQARTILFARGMFGLVAPASPQWETKAEELSDDFKATLRTAGDFEASITAFLGKHPDVEPADLLSATVFETEAEYAGPSNPTDETFEFIDRNSELIAGFPAAAPWVLPQGHATDPFSHRAWSQQVARGMRKRKTSEDFLGDIYFRGASRDYFDARELHDANMLTAVGEQRSQLNREWTTWSAAYKRMHPVFANMLEDPTRRQRRRQAIDELVTMSAGEDSIVPDELADLVESYHEYQLSTAGLRGDRRQAVLDRRRALTEDFVTWALWHVQQHPQLAGFWMQVMEPELRGLDDDAVTRGAA